MSKRTILGSGILAASVLLGAGCVVGPKVTPEPVPEPKPTPPPVPAGFTMKPFQQAMREEMRRSYELADEILIGVYTGSREDERYGLTYYFDEFISFDKSTLSWGPVMKVIVEVLPHDLRPELITPVEFEGLSEADRTGICWDVFRRKRTLFLVEGQKMLAFIKLDFDEASIRSTRSLIDFYPATEDCEAKAVFDLMVRDLVADKHGL